MTFTFAATALIICLALAWNSNTWLNISIKTILTMMALWGIVNSLELLGFIMRVTR